MNMRAFSAESRAAYNKTVKPFVALLLTLAFYAPRILARSFANFARSTAPR